jgi:hypothetical protein
MSSYLTRKASITCCDFFAVPVARLAVDQRHVRADLGQTVLEAFAALDGGGVAGLTGDLDDAGLVLDAQFGETLAHDLGRARALRDVVGTRERATKSKPSSAMLELVTITGMLGLVGLAHGGDHGLAVGRPDDDRVDFLLDEVLHLRDLAGHVAAGVENDDLDIGLASAAAMKACS